jgi:hypothetical protein
MAQRAPSRALGRTPEPVPTLFATVADGVRAQVVHREHLLPPHLSTRAHEGRAASCPCHPLLEQLQIGRQWSTTVAGTREACTQEQHELVPFLVGTWPGAPEALRLQAYRGRVDLTLTRCRWCGAIEVRDTSFHAPAGLRLGSLTPRRRSDVLGWYAGSRPRGRVHL